MTESPDERINKIIKEVAELSDSFEILAAQNLKSDLEIDSLTMIDLVTRLEIKLAIRIDEMAIRGFITVGDLHRYVKNSVTDSIS